MIELTSNTPGFMPIFVHDIEQIWRRALELADKLDKENELGLTEEEELDAINNKDFVHGDLYEDDRI